MPINNAATHDLPRTWPPLSPSILALDITNAVLAFERAYFMSMIVRFDGNLSKVAAFSGMSDHATVRRKLRQLGLWPIATNQLRRKVLP